jgi:hypothetical protein
MHVAQVCRHTLCILSRCLPVDAWRCVLAQAATGLLKQLFIKMVGNALKHTLWGFWCFACYPVNIWYERG